MGFWDVNDFTAARMNRLGPWVDEIVGTDGNYASLNSAVAAGATRIILCDGAYLSAALSLTNVNGGFIVHMGPGILNLGAYGITVTEGAWRFEGFRLASGSGVGIYLATNALSSEFARVRVVGFSSHGIQLGTNANDHLLYGCTCTTNGGDGIKVGANSSCARIEASMSYGNTGYGVNDTSNSAIVVGNRLDGNTAGAIGGTPSIDVGNKKT